LNNGNVTLPRVRNGWVELLVELDDGTVYNFTISVPPSGDVVLKLS